MKKYLLSLLSITAMLVSCKKEDTKDAANIEGTFKLKYITASTNSIITSTDGEKTITTSDYTTANNNGTITFSNSTLTATGLAYTVDTEAKGLYYLDNELVDSLSFPIQFTLPASTSVAPYQLIGSDSIYFPQGSFTSDASGMFSGQSQASGGRYSRVGDILTITQHYLSDSSYDDSGETIQQHNSAVASIILQKQ